MPQPIPSPFPFVPHHKAPEAPGDDPILFAFRGRELLVTEEFGLPSVEQIDAIVDLLMNWYSENSKTIKPSGAAKAPDAPNAANP